MDKITGNKIIAKFMGITILNDWDDPDVLKKISPNAMLPNQIKYDQSWDWLIKVVEKIEGIFDEHHGFFGVYISSNSCTIQGTFLHRSIDNPDYGAVYMSDPNAILNTKIESTWYNVVQFIQWYQLHSPQAIKPLTPKTK
jgi:hypothetical protein